MRIVVKIGTRSLLSDNDTLDLSVLQKLTDQIATLKHNKHKVALVSSGAVGAGRLLWQDRSTNTNINDEVLQKQILASLGQANLIENYNKCLAKHDMLAAQILLTRNDFKHRRHSVNIGRLLDKLLSQHNLLPIINENDSISLEELMFTDNDELAGLLAAQIGAERLILLTDVDGVYDMSREDKVVIPEIAASDIGKLDLSMRGGGRGGMQSKLDTAAKMSRIGVQTHIVRAQENNILTRIVSGEEVGTVIRPKKKKKPIKRWLSAGVQETRGEITVNTPLAEKLLSSSQALSILPVGIISINSPFTRGDVVVLKDDQGRVLGHGMAKYSHDELSSYIGKKNKPVFIHYNALHIEREAAE